MKTLSVLAAALILASGMAGAQPAQPSRIPGDLIALKGGTVTIKSAAGETLEIALAEPLRVLAVSQTDFSAIKPGAYVAVTALPQADGSLLASRINIFPESMRGVGEGHRPMAALPGNTMTNATVATVAGSPGGNTMTNATVTTVADATQVRYLTVHYPGGNKQVLVPPGLPIMLLEAVERSKLVPGAHLIVTATRLDGAGWIANSITVGKDGSIPPS